ncbi:mycofactocin-coupled SDR family oxidoreductase [Geodermatophilus sabuli]|uniref:SDR family mycofactocin-dependent oxidoreductase n=1 Tax=Geodermatophilus sabuli TaxID=1564158 RepID=A0A285E9E6_9ACTN|nr:mycofactocin-coupled SDR family oxidoreductase [Geodermatophilus sabuli]MBB3082414.1 SDR family mycofactocin-dependent oxidoreductase [Geodermatophilus sabuli]SNX94716.1 SDR family mycofactocin-dependent oxidoreductase [Geodermatophilus sabuli]
MSTVPQRQQGKVVFITGAARGQGRAHALRLAAEGADVLALDLAGPLPGVPYESATPDDLAETARQVEALGRRVLTHRGDVRDLEDMKGFLAKGMAEFGRLDGVVANAGICIPATWEETTPEIFKDTLDINVTGVWNTVMAAAPHLVAGGGGSIVLTSSYAGKKMQPFMIHYTTSKHAVTGMTRAFAAELGKHSIRVNSVHPGAIATPMGGGDMVAAIERTNASNPPLAQMGTAFLPQGWMEADEIASAVAFLLSDDARFITAEHLSIDAGMQYF